MKRDMRQMKPHLTFLLLLSGLSAMAACKAPASPAAEALATPSASARPVALPATAARPPVVVFLGDSLTAGLGLEEPQAYPAVLGTRFAAQGRPIRVINAGVSGDTTAGGVRRLDWLLRQKPDVVVVGLGANDALRGAAPEEIERNLREILRRCRAAGARVLLLGMMIPPNYGPDYAGRFTALYPRIAKDMGVPLVPFLLAGVGGIPELNQADGIHPTAVGQQKVADNVYPYLREVLAGTRTAAGR
ncbi:MAG: acyl-CoA thioesterase [Acidobacteriota bacterium]|jgi:acyl-CoA thioesterase-1|nr:acyl-CoA thioesterase [Acidobacteriota bacterium]